MAKRKNNEVTGTCRHCRQTRLIYLPDGWIPEDKEQDDYDNLATEQCECERAVSEAEKNEKKLKAIARMTEYYDELLKMHNQNTKEGQKEWQLLEKQKGLMIRIIETVADEQISGAVVGITKCETFTVMIKANGDLQIKRQYKGTEEWIF